MYPVLNYRKVLTYCTVHIIKNEFQQFKDDWNSHRLRRNTKSLLPSGIPNDLFDMPGAYGKPYFNYLQ